MKNKTSCLLPNSRNWLRRSKRQLSGWEKLLLQGLPIDAYGATDFNNEQTGRLAGEAFNGFVMVCVKLAYYHAVLVDYGVK